MEHHLTWTDHLIPNWELPGSYALISEDPGTDTAIVFFHGFLGDAHETWLNFQSMIDSQRSKYPEWDRSDLFFVQYSSFRKSISSIASIVLQVVDHLFPVPPPTLFEIDVMVEGVPENVIEMSLVKHEYKKLILVGHSEGGAALRRAVEVAYKDDTRVELRKKLAITELNLFAPAHLGFEPKGWLGACLSVSRIKAVAMTVLHLSRAFVEMEAKTTLINTLNNTNAYADEAPTFKALRARVLIGDDDDVVAHGEFKRDIVLDPPEPNQDHASICKPRPGYPRPLPFAQGKE